MLSSLKIIAKNLLGLTKMEIPLILNECFPVVELKAEQYFNKRYFIIDQQIVQHFVQCNESLLNPPSLTWNLNNYLIFNSRISAIKIKNKDFSQL